MVRQLRGDDPSADSHFGVSVSAAGDVNGDGLADVIVGAWRNENNGKLSGSAWVFSGGKRQGTNYCGPSVPNSTGLPAIIEAAGSEVASVNNLGLLATQLPQDVFGYFLASETQGFMPNPNGSDGNLCLSGKIGRFVKQIQKSGTLGEISIIVDLTFMPLSPPHSVIAGETWNFQAWYRDKTGGQATSNFSDGISILFN